jgi:hypothetical protein
VWVTISGTDARVRDGVPESGRLMCARHDHAACVECSTIDPPKSVRPLRSPELRQRRTRGAQARIRQVHERDSRHAARDRKIDRGVIGRQGVGTLDADERTVPTCLRARRYSAAVDTIDTSVVAPSTERIHARLISNAPRRRSAARNGWS